MAFFACGTRDELRARRSGGRPFIDGRPNKRIFHARMYSERDGLSGWAVFRKVCPRIGAQSGPHFPVDVLSGNYVPELRLGMGCTFRLRALAESATRNLLLKWDALSQQALKRKLHPIPDVNSGTRFPDAKRPHDVAFNLYMFSRCPHDKPRFNTEASARRHGT